MVDYLKKAERATFTTILLLPAVGQTRRNLVKYGFINGYLDDKDHEIHYEEAVYTLFKPENWPRFEIHLDREMKSENIITQYDYSGGYIVLVYSILEKFKEDYNKFIEGRYSQFSNEYKECFPKFVRTIDREGREADEVSLPHHIISRSESLRKMREKELDIKMDIEAEVWSKIDINKETLDINKIRQQ